MGPAYLMDDYPRPLILVMLGHFLRSSVIIVNLSPLVVNYVMGILGRPDLPLSS